ncbi:MAG: hypothetical protein ABJC12_02180 [Saprospiraceae bacterium]
MIKILFILLLFGSFQILARPTALSSSNRNKNATLTNVHTTSSAETLKTYTGEYTNPETYVSFTIVVKDGKLMVSNSSNKDDFFLEEIGHDLFESKGQKFLFQRSIKTKDIIGFSIQMKGLPDKPFVRIKH